MFGCCLFATFGLVWLVVRFFAFVLVNCALVWVLLLVYFDLFMLAVCGLGSVAGDLVCGLWYFVIFLAGNFGFGFSLLVYFWCVVFLLIWVFGICFDWFGVVDFAIWCFRVYLMVCFALVLCGFDCGFGLAVWFAFWLFWWFCFGGFVLLALDGFVFRVVWVWFRRTCDFVGLDFEFSVCERLRVYFLL